MTWVTPIPDACPAELYIRVDGLLEPADSGVHVADVVQGPGHGVRQSAAAGRQRDCGTDFVLFLTHSGFLQPHGPFGAPHALREASGSKGPGSG